jgi:hypothetical protein
MFSISNPSSRVPCNVFMIQMLRLKQVHPCLMIFVIVLFPEVGPLGTEGPRQQVSHIVAWVTKIKARIDGSLTQFIKCAYRVCQSNYGTGCKLNREARSQCGPPYFPRYAPALKVVARMAPVVTIPVLRRRGYVLRVRSHRCLKFSATVCPELRLPCFANIRPGTAG